MKYKPGESGNPNGRKPMSADFVARLHHWITTHTYDDIITLSRSKKQLGQLPVTDYLVCQRLIEAMREGGADTMNSLWDRLIGKPTQHTTLDARLIGHVTISQEQQQLEADIQARAMLDAISLRAKGIVIDQPALPIALAPKYIEKTQDTTPSVSGDLSTEQADTSPSKNTQVIEIK